MSDALKGLLRAALFAGVATTAWPACVSAQVPVQEGSAPPMGARLDASLQHELDSLMALHGAAEAALDSAIAREREARLRERHTELDTQRVGILTVISPRNIAERARAATERALAPLGSLGEDPDGPLSGLSLLVEERYEPAFYQMHLQPNHVRLWLPGHVDPRRRSQAVSRALQARLADGLPEDLRGWLGGGAGFDTDEAMLSGVYRSLALGNSLATEACFAGDAQACAAALGLADPGPMWRDWYSPDQLAGRVERVRPRHLAADTLFAACFDAGDARACEAISAERRWVPAPLSDQARQTLVAYALEQGGAAGFTLLSSDTTMPLLERIASAAGTTPDALIDGWRTRVMAARPRFSAGLGRSWVATLLWAVGLAALAMRSTRWRLG